MVRLHDGTIKDLLVNDGDAFHYGSRRGNGPALHCNVIEVVRGRSPTLELEHGPNSYGRQQ